MILQDFLYSMMFQKCIGSDMFLWIRHCVVEVCTPPSALLVVIVDTLVVMVEHYFGIVVHFVDEVKKS